MVTDGDWLDLDDLPAAAGAWLRAGRIFALNVDGQTLLPSYQFDTHGEPLAVIKDILEAFGPANDLWTLAAWFHYPNGRLTTTNGESGWINLAPKDCLDRPASVVCAAKNRGGTYIA